MENKNCKSGSCSLTQEQVDFIKMSGSLQGQVVKKSKSGVKIKIFGKNNCDICKIAVEKLNKFLFSMNTELLTMNYYNLDTLDGLTEAAIYTAFDVPTIVVESASGVEIKRWKNLPDEEEIKNVCSGLS